MNITQIQMNQNIEQYTKSQLEKYMSECSIHDLHQLKLKYDDMYYNTGKSELDDWKYDMIISELEKRDKSYSGTVGAKLRESDVEVNLPCWLGSLDKFKPNDTGKLKKWLKYMGDDTEAVCTPKLDGVSCLLCTDEKGDVKLYTRGNGKNGKDITYIAKYVNYIPKMCSKNICVRGELVMSKRNFEYIKNEKAVNPRNTVSGLVKAKTMQKGLKYVDFIAYELITTPSLNILKQFEILSKYGFRVVSYSLLKPEMDILSKRLSNLRETYIYEIDGLVLHSKQIYKRNKSGNPKYAIAFKEDYMCNATVVDVLWNTTKSGMLKPRVQIKPVFICGVTITFLTGYNASYIEQNKIGKGCELLITRSGDVIPRIMDIVKPCKTGGQMPNNEYKWNDTHVDIFVMNTDNDEQREKEILYFLRAMNILGIGNAIIKKMVSNGINTILKMIAVSEKDLIKLDGIQQRLAKKIYNAIHSKLENVSLSDLMVGSCIFGFGIGNKRVKLLLEHIPNVLNTKIDMNMIINIPGFSSIMAKKIVNNMENFKVFYEQILPYVKIEQNVCNKKAQKLQKYEGKRIVMSGFRDKKLQSMIEEQGGIVATSMSKNVWLVLVKDKTSTSSKIEKARELGVKILTRDEFEN